MAVQVTVTHSADSADYYKDAKQLGEIVLNNVNQFVSHNYLSNTNDILIENKFMKMKEVLKIKQFDNHVIPALVGQHGVLSQLKIKENTILGCIFCPYYTKSAWNDFHLLNIHQWYSLNCWEIGNYVVSPFDHQTHHHLTIWSFINDIRLDITKEATDSEIHKQNVIFQEFIINSIPSILVLAVQDIEPNTELVTYYGNEYIDSLSTGNPSIKPCDDTLYNVNSFPTTCYHLSSNGTKLKLIQKPLNTKDLADVKENNYNLCDVKENSLMQMLQQLNAQREELRKKVGIVNVKKIQKKIINDYKNNNSNKWIIKEMDLMTMVRLVFAEIEALKISLRNAMKQHKKKKKFVCFFVCLFYRSLE